MFRKFVITRGCVHVNVETGTSYFFLGTKFKIWTHSEETF
jgi:hypothetical protein